MSTFTLDLTTEALQNLLKCMKKLRLVSPNMEMLSENNNPILFNISVEMIQTGSFMIIPYLPLLDTLILNGDICGTNGITIKALSNSMRNNLSDMEFSNFQKCARDEILANGGSISHHHGGEMHCIQM